MKSNSPTKLPVEQIIKLKSEYQIATASFKLVQLQIILIQMWAI